MGKSKSKPTQAQIDSIYERLRTSGLRLRHVVAQEGIPPGEFAAWVREGNRPDGAKACRDLVIWIQRAEAKLAERPWDIIHRAINDDDVRAAQWFLKTRCGYGDDARPDQDLARLLQTDDGLDDVLSLESIRKSLTAVRSARTEALASGSFVAAQKLMEQEVKLLEMAQELVAEEKAAEAAARDSGQILDRMFDVLGKLPASVRSEFLDRAQGLSPDVTKTSQPDKG